MHVTSSWDSTGESRATLTLQGASSGTMNGATDSLVARVAHQEEDEHAKENEDAVQVNMERDDHVHKLICIILFHGPRDLANDPHNGNPQNEDGKEEGQCGASRQGDAR
jgi:hypothetical protein